MLGDRTVEVEDDEVGTTTTRNIDCLLLFSHFQIPLGLLPVTKEKPHKHVTIGFCRKQQVSSVREGRGEVLLLTLSGPRQGWLAGKLGLMRNNFQGYSVLGHCMMLLLFILSLILIVALMYWMVGLAVACHCPD